MARPLAPREFYPAGQLEISQRLVALPTGVTVRIAERGPRDGIPVVMIPGWCTSLYMYRHALERLPAYGIRAIAVDPRGCGLADRPRRRGAYTFEAYRADLDALLDALGLSRVVLVGQSMGGGFALRYALRGAARLRAVVLINPTSLVALAGLRVLRATPRALLEHLGRRFVPRFLVGFILRRLAYGNPRLVTESDVDEYWATTQLPGFMYAARASLSEFEWSRITDAEARSLAVPSLVILGDHDRLVHADVGAAQRLAGTTVRVLPGGHCVHEEDPVEAYGLMGEFISALPP